MGLESEEFVLPSGETAQLRGLTGYEIALAQKTRQGDSVTFNAFMLGLSMGADEKVAESTGIEWMKSHLAGDFRAATKHVQTISGLDEDATKSRVDSDGDQPG